MKKLKKGATSLADWCIANDRDDLLEQYSPENDITVYEIAKASHDKVLWLCPKCGRTYPAAPMHRTSEKHPTGCPKCSMVYSGSVADMSIYNYFKEIYTKTAYRNRELGFELDIVIPEISIAIEYDGYIYHGIDAEYSDKADILQNYEYTLIRIIGASYKEEQIYKHINNEYIVVLNQDDCNHYAMMIGLIINIINEERQSDLKINTNLIDESVKKAYKQMTNKESNNKLSDKVPDIKEYYHKELNGGIELDTISAGAHMFLNLKCPKCNNQFSLHVSNILASLEKGTCLCQQCRRTTPNKKDIGYRRSLLQIFTNIADFWHDSNELKPEEIRAEDRNIRIKLECPHCKSIIERIPQQMCNNNYRRGSKLRCNNCKGSINLKITENRVKRHTFKEP